MTESHSEHLPPFITTKPGFYRHYKGGEYEVVDTVRHSEDLQPMTLYRALYGERGLWVRPSEMFNETVLIEGVMQPRFKYLGDSPTDKLSVSSNSSNSSTTE